MGYEKVDTSGNVKRLGDQERQRRRCHRHRDDCRVLRFADLGAGSVHHIAFAVENRAKQLEVRKALIDTGYQVTPVIDRDYFWAIYFRTPGGVLFEVATNEPGFDRDEDTAHLGEALKLPSQHAHLQGLSGKAPAAARRLTERAMSTQSYIHKALPGSAGRAAAFPLPRHRRRREPVVALGRELVPDATIVSPRGDVSEYGAARFFRRTGEGVYDMDDLARATAKMAGFVRAHVDAAKPSGGARPRLFQRREHPGVGAVLRSPALFDAVVLMHPLIPFEPEVKASLAGQRILVTAGRRDPICPPNLTSRLEAHLRARRRRCHSGMARGRPRTAAERNRGGQAFLRSTATGA